MRQIPHCPLIKYHSFALPSVTPMYYEISSIEDLSIIHTLPLSDVYFLGEGTNTLFVDSSAPIIVRPAIKGVSFEETATHYRVKAACGENWHQLVVTCLAKGIGGLENLALIPGSVGAAPVQNIGAYGVEIADVLHAVVWYDFRSQSTKTMTNTECKFGYRDSVFKQALSGKGLIIEVEFTLPKLWQANKRYSGLDQLSDDVSATDIFNKVIEIRQQKLPEPSAIPNAGSFFKNPVITRQQFNQLQTNFPNVPFYNIAGERVKIPAAWLIDQAGLKGYKVGNAAVHVRQALVLTNCGGATGQDVIRLAQHVISTIEEKFDLILEQEVRTIGQHGFQAIEVKCG